jgi:hypothetical protein
MIIEVQTGVERGRHVRRGAIRTISIRKNFEKKS